MQYTDLQSFFVERFIELLHKNTLDSYRVRTHNAYTLLKELQELLLDWGNNQIKQFETIKLCIEETKEAITKDTCLSYPHYSKTILVQELDACMKNGDKDISKSKRLIMLLNNCVNYNKDKYLQNLFDSIESILFKDEHLKEENFIKETQLLDAYVSDLCRQLLYIGYSKVHLYVYLSNLDYKSNFKDTFTSLKNKFLFSEEKEFIVVFKLSFPETAIKDGNINEFKTQIDEELDIPKERFSKFIKPAKSVRFLYL